MKLMLDQIPCDKGHFHFIGIAGIGMSALAKLMHDLGYKVTGSDISCNLLTLGLEKNGIKIFQNHKKTNIEGAYAIVRSSAIGPDNIEIKEAKKKALPVIDRGQLLASIMSFYSSISVCGTHGKTTITSMIAQIFEPLDPTVINGGIITKKGTNSYIGKGNFLIAEVDESDGTLIHVPSYCGIISNIEPEHMDYYKDIEGVHKAYAKFIKNIPFYGFCAVCFDDINAKQVAQDTNTKNIISYGIDDKSLDFVGINISSNLDGVNFDIAVNQENLIIENLTLKAHGKHNIRNAIASVAIAYKCGIKPTLIRSMLSDFTGTKRRFSDAGNINGIQIIDDYAHHPTEVMATLDAAKEMAKNRGGRVIAVLQPHRYTRLRDMMDDFARSFCDADIVFITPVYTAGESPIDGVNSKHLVEKIRTHIPDNKSVQYIDDIQNLGKSINSVAFVGDVVIMLGAGDITKYANNLSYELSKYSA